MDNGTHGDAVGTMSALGQLRALMRDGTITQSCDGVCDPN